MLKLIYFAVFVANLNFASTDTPVSEVTTNDTVTVSIPVDDPSDEGSRIRCGPNQVYVFCPLCPATCRNRNQMIKCTRLLQTDRLIFCPRPRCQCIDGFFMNDYGKCVKEEECPPQCERNQVYSDCATNPCLPTCKEPLLNTYCRPNPAVCKPGCICADGFVKDNGTCVPKENCTTKCKENEEYTNCTTQICRPQSCKELGYPLPCLQSDQIDMKCNMPGCVCKEGFVRSEEGVCMSIKNCSKILCPKPNEYYDLCPPDNCPPRTCDVGDVATFVPCQSPSDPSKCKPSCVCNPGLFKNNNGDCVTLAECPPQCERNQVYSDCATNPCLPTCKEPLLNTYCRPNPAVCKPGCICADGFVKDNGTCVPKENCTTKCKENEEYTNCTTQICRPQSCKELGYPLQCLQFDQTNVKCKKPGCVCKEGFVRGDDNVCMSVKNCTSCGGDPNAMSSCTNYCRRCTNHENEKRICFLDCNQNSCECKEGYSYDAPNNKCVLTKECPPIKCGPTEVVSNCANSPCIRSCATRGINIFCRPYLPNCETGCVCAAGSMRDYYGNCIPAEKCPSVFLDDTLPILPLKS